LAVAFVVVDTARATVAAPNVRRQITNGGSVGAADSGLGTTDCTLRECQQRSHSGYKKKSGLV
jgi:hypothetical protein